MGALVPEPAARVPAHRERRRGGAARSDGGGARVGERGRLFLRAAVGLRARDRPRRQRDRADPARVGEQRADDVLLLRAGSGGATRVRPRRPSRARAIRAPVAGVGRRHARHGGDLPRVQPRELGRGGLGHRDVDRHGVRAGIAHAVRPAGWDRLRAFMLTVVIADELLALVVIALVYSDSIDVMPLIWAAGLFAVALVLLLGLKLRRGPPYFVLGSAMWVVALESGIEPLVVGSRLGSWHGPRPRPA